MSNGCRILSYNNDLFDLESLKRDKDYAISSTTRSGETVYFNFCDKYVDLTLFKSPKDQPNTHAYMTGSNPNGRLTSQSHRPSSIESFKDVKGRKGLDISYTAGNLVCKADPERNMTLSYHIGCAENVTNLYQLSMVRDNENCEV